MEKRAKSTRMGRKWNRKRLPMVGTFCSYTPLTRKKELKVEEWGESGTGKGYQWWEPFVVIYPLRGKKS
jgi:hypothetical protein